VLISPPGNDSFREDLRFTSEVFSFQHKISEMHWSISVKFCTLIRPSPNFIMPVQNFEGPTPEKF